MEPNRHALHNRALDALGQEWDEYKKAVRRVDMDHGRSGMGMAERARKIEALVRHLAALAPPRAQGVPLDPAQAPVGELLTQLREAREAVLPRRRQHKPQFKYAINHESGPQIAFLREFAGQWSGPDAAYIKQHFPHLHHAAQWAEKIVTLYDRIEELQARYTRRTVPQPLTPEARRELAEELNQASSELLNMWPPFLPADKRAAAYLPEGELKRYNEAVSNVRLDLGKLPTATHPDRADAVADMQAMFNDLRYEACAAAHRGFLQVSRAYRADRMAMMGRPELQDARDPIGQELPMLDRVYHARWALLADAVFDTVQSNRKMLEKYSGLAPQTRGEAEQERAAARGFDDKGQGQLF